MVVYRLSRKKYAHELSGYGASLFGNRWNSKGIGIIYTAESRALAMSEVLVHLIKQSKIRQDCMILEINLPHTSVIDVDANNLPEEWNKFPLHPETQNLGNQFIRNRKHLAMRVPSAIVKGDFNILINPYHPDFEKVEIIAASEFLFDDRFF